ncbi:MAG TPA: B-box zinc finger protein [Candidatus Angelobacter sp.]|nr:B-box zinc finger protein [Candidatus Angelobacter sp.]
MPKLIIVIGSILAAIGAVCFLALFGQSQSETIRAIGSACFALGVLIIAAGLYLQARRLQSQYQPSVSKVKKTDRLCSSCNQEPAVLFCRVHVLRLCLNCLEKHDDGTNCSYVPARRATAAYK